MDRFTKARMEEFDRRYEANRPIPNGQKAVRATIKGVGTYEFDSIIKCARQLSLSQATISEALRSGGAFGDITFELIEPVE